MYASEVQYHIQCIVLHACLYIITIISAEQRYNNINVYAGTYLHYNV